MFIVILPNLDIICWTTILWRLSGSMLWTLGTTACLPIPSCPCCFFSCSVEFIYHQARALSNNYYWDIFLKPSAGCYHPPPPSAPKCQHATAVLWQWIASSSCIHHQHWLLPVPKSCIWLTNQLLHQMKRWPVMLPAALSALPLPAKRLRKAGETFYIPAAPAWAWAPCSCSQSRKVGYTSLCQWPDRRTSVKGTMVTFEYWLVLLLNTCQSLLECILVCSLCIQVGGPRDALNPYQFQWQHALNYIFYSHHACIALVFGPYYFNA